MGFLAPAIPWIAKGGAALLGGLFSKSAQSSAQKRSPEEQAALGGASGAAGNLAGFGSQLYGQGMPAVGSAQNYWSTLLTGNRGAMRTAVAGPTAAITDQYRGAERGLERSGIRGGVKDLATAELGRQKAGQIAGLTTGVQPAAAGQLGQLGAQLTGQGINAAGGAGQLYSGLLGQGYQNRLQAMEQGRQAGAATGNLLFDILTGGQGTGGGKGGGGGGGGGWPNPYDPSILISDAPNSRGGGGLGNAPPGTFWPDPYAGSPVGMLQNWLRGRGQAGGGGATGGGTSWGTT